MWSCAASPDLQKVHRTGFAPHIVCDALGNPLKIGLTSGQAGDCPQSEPLLERVAAVEPVVPASGTPDTETPDTKQRPALETVLTDNTVTVRTIY